MGPALLEQFKRALQHAFAATGFLVFQKLSVRQFDRHSLGLAVCQFHSPPAIKRQDVFLDLLREDCLCLAYDQSTRT